MKIKKIGLLNKQGEIEITTNSLSGTRPGDLAAILTNMPDSKDGIGIKMSIILGKDSSTKIVWLPLPSVDKTMLDLQLSQPTKLYNHQGCFNASQEGDLFGILMFRNKVYFVEDDVFSDTSEEEAILLIKKLSYSEDNRLKRLREEIKALDQLVSNGNSTHREAITDSVKLLVYNRYGGKCVNCGSDKDLHFDHIIPFSKGGSNTEKNIQILCERCNLQKSDNIA